MNTTSPLVSIVIPTHNRPELLARALRSVLAQSFTDYEVIVVDDGDAPRAEDVVRGFSDARFQYVAHIPPNRGGSATRNTGIKTARASFIAFLDDDDEWLPEKLATQMSEFGSTPLDVGFSVTAVANITDDGEMINKVTAGVHDFLPILLLRFKGFLTSTLVVRKSALDDVGGFDEALPSHQEADLLLRIGQKYKGLGIAAPLVRMNMLSNRGDHIGGNALRRILGREMLLEKHKALYANHRHELSKLLFWLALWCRDAGQLSKARPYFFRAFLISGNPRYLMHGLIALYKKDFVCQ